MEYIQPTSLMKSLLVKLCQLNYHNNFCSPEFPVLYHAYFLTKIQNTNQFYYFISLCSWLLQQCNCNFVEWSQFDAPDVICKSIIEETRNICGEKLNLSANKMREGYGNDVLTILNKLCDCVILTQKIKYANPIYPAPSHEKDIEYIDVDNDILEDNMTSYTYKTQALEENDKKQEVLTVKKVDKKSWYAKVEKAHSRLKVKKFRNKSEWRTHAYKVQNHAKILEKSSSDISKKLMKNHRNLEKELNRAHKKEKIINENFSNVKHTFITVQKEKDILNKDFENINNTVNTLTQELHEINEQINYIKTQTNKQNETMTDISPLQKMRETIKSLQDETSDMNLRIAVQQHQTLRKSRV